MNKKISLWRLNEVKQLFFMSGYLLLFWLIHLATISVIVFFHFLLEHDLSVIDTWIQDESWKIVITAKLLAAFPVVRSVLLYSNDRHPFRDVMRRSMIKPRRQILVISFLMVALSVIMGRPEPSSLARFEFLRFFWSFWGILVFYLSDLLVFFLLQLMLPVSTKARVTNAIVFSTLATIIYYYTLPYAEGVSVFVGFSLLFLIYLCFWRTPNWTESSLFSVLSLALMGALFGHDPLWASRFSPFIFSESIALSSFIVMFVVFFIYLKWTQKTTLSHVKY